MVANKALAAILCACMVIVTCKRSETDRALIKAVTKGDAAQAASLLAKGARPDAREETGIQRTALIIAAGEDYEEIAAALVKAGADVNARAADGSTALMYAAAEGNESILRLLLAKGADTRAADNAGQTALIKAASSGHAAACAVLLDHGADMEAADKAGYTALMKAIINGRDDAAALLRSRGAALTDRQRQIIENALRTQEGGEEIQTED